MTAAARYSTHPHERPAPTTPSTPTDMAVRIVQLWLGAGMVCLLFAPALRESNDWIGSLPFWLVGVPLANWLILRWRGAIAATRATAMRWRRQGRAKPTRLSRRVKAPRRRQAGAISRPGRLLTALISR